MNQEIMPSGDNIDRTKAHLTWAVDPPETPLDAGRESSVESLIEGGARLVATPEQVEAARNEMDADIFEQLKGARDKITTLTGENTNLQVEVARLKEALRALQGQIADIIEPDNNN